MINIQLVIVESKNLIWSFVTIPNASVHTPVLPYSCLFRLVPFAILQAHTLLHFLFGPMILESQWRRRPYTTCATRGARFEETKHDVAHRVCMVLYCVLISREGVQDNLAHRVCTEMPVSAFCKQEDENARAPCT